MSSETLASAGTVAMATPATGQVATTPSAYPRRAKLERRHSKVLDYFYQHEKQFPFHPNSCFIKAYQKFWKKYLSHRMTFEEFACINTFYAPSMVIDLILSIGNIITNPCKCEAKCTCTMDESLGSDAMHRALLTLKEGNAAYYDRSISDDHRRRDHVNRVGYLRNAAQFPELRAKHQQVWLEAVGIQLLEAMEFMHMQLLGGLQKICVQYLQSPAERARFRITLKNGRMLDFLGKPFDTSKHCTNSAGKGFAICAFVKDNENGGFFAHTHTVGHFHHSSFFAGEPVNFAGEIKVTNGRLEVVTQNSGHYKPNEMHLIAMLRFLRKCGFDLSKFECWMYKADKFHQYEGKERYSSKLAKVFYEDYSANFPVYVELVSHAKCSATAAMDGNSYLPSPDGPNSYEYRRYLENTSTGYDSYRKVDCNETSSANELTPLETQPPVGPELEQIAEEFTQLALLGKLVKVKEMMSAKTWEFGAKNQFVNIKNERQQTALYCAARQGHLEMLQHLLRYEANPNITEQHGSTPLHAAAFAGHKDCCMSLLSWKADASIKNKFNLTALDELRQYSRFPLRKKYELELLLKAALMND